MSLVAYESSDDSDSEDTPSSFASEGKARGLFARLPAPKQILPQSLEVESRTGTTLTLRESSSNDGETRLLANLNKKSESDPESQGPRSAREGLDIKGMISNLPKPKKRTEPVKITIPEIKPEDSDSDDDEPVKKKAFSSQNSGLSSLLPQPKNLVVKEIQRALVPHTLTKRPAPDPRVSQGLPGASTSPSAIKAAAKRPAPDPRVSQGLPGASASPSAIKAAAKSAAKQLARQMVAEEEGSDDELAPENYFSLAESSQRPLIPSLDPQPSVPSTLPLPPGTENAPLDFGSHVEGSLGSGGAWDGTKQKDYNRQYQEPSGGLMPDPCPQDYYSGAYYQDPDPGSVEADEPGSSSLFDEEAFRRLQGKRNRGKEEVKFLEIKGDDQLSGNQQWMTKNITEEKEQRKSFSKKKGEQPTGQQRRKHQITYLIHQAKERELELKNNWAENKLTRRQTQAKYGF